MSLGDLQALRDAYATRLGPVAAQAAPTAPVAGLSELSSVGGGWQQSLTPAERWLIEHEGGYNPSAKNPTSTAFGIWQGLESTRKRYLGTNWQTTDANLQLDAMRRYVSDRYGNAENAQRFHEQNGFY